MPAAVTDFKTYIEEHSIPVPESGCWLWLGGLNQDGYGIINLTVDGKKVVNAHRLAWTVYYGPIPEGVKILHKCDTPSCCFYGHLMSGSQTDNVRDMDHKGRRNTAPRVWGEAHHNSKLTADAVRAIRAAASQGATSDEIAVHYSISRRTVSKVCSYTSWKHIS